MSLTKFRLVLALPLAAAIVLAGCSSNDAGPRPYEGKYYGSGQHDTPAKDDYVSRSGWRNQRGHLGDNYSARAARIEERRMPVPAPTRGGPDPIPPTRPAPAPAPQLSSSSSMTFPIGDPSKGVILLEKTVPPEVRVGQPYAMDLRVTNLTDHELEEVTVLCVANGPYSMSGSTPNSTPRDGRDTWDLGKMGPRESRNIRVTGSATAVGDVTVCCLVTWNNRLCVTTRVIQPRIEIQKSAPTQVLACEPITLRFRVKNTGDGTARNVRITDPLPAGWKAADGSSTLNMMVGDLTTGQEREVTAQVTPGARGTYQNTATAEADGGLTAQSNTTTTKVVNCALAITKTAPERRYIGRNVVYQISVTNTGDGEARNAMLEDMIPSGATFVSASDGGQNQGSKVVWDLGTIPPGGSRNVTLTCKAGGAGTLHNTATARAYCCDPGAQGVSASADTIVAGIPAVLLEVIDLEDPIELGGEVTYVVTVTNQGSAEDTNIRIDIEFESGHQYLSSSGSTPVASGAPGASAISFQPLGVLAPKQKAEWRIRVKAQSAGDQRIKITMNTDQLGRPVQETEATNFYQ